VEQFGLAVAALIARCDTAGRYDQLVADFREGGISLVLTRDGLTVREEAPVPPPTHN